MVLGKIILQNGRGHFGPTGKSDPYRYRIAKARTIRACAKAGWGQCFFFLSAGRVTLLHETGFLHMEGIKIFGYQIVIEKESEKISKFSKKIVLKP